MKRLRQAPAAAVAVLTTALSVAAVMGLWSTVDGDQVRSAMGIARGDAVGLMLSIGGFGTAFWLRALAWQRVMPQLPLPHALAGIHVALAANHVLPLRLGEPLRVVSVVRRAGVDPADATASTVLLRTADVVALLLLGAAAAPLLLASLLGPTGIVAALALVGLGLTALWALWYRRRAASALRAPDAVTVGLTTAAWGLEAILVWQVAAWFGVSLSPAEAVIVLAAAVGAQLVAVTPGGIGTYEAAAAGGLIAVGVPPATAAATAVSMHALKTVYSLTSGVVGAVWPAPSMWGRLRLGRPTQRRIGSVKHGPVVLFLPAHNEGPRVAGVIRRAPATVAGHPVRVVVIDDGSDDDTVAQARAAGATVVPHDHNKGLGAAVRTGLSFALRFQPGAVVFCDADGEYDPAQLPQMVAPILSGQAEYVVGSRFTGRIDRMHPHRRIGNLVLTAWLRWTVRRPLSDGQSGYRALSPAAAAAAHIPHDYNYAQVLTIDLLSKGFGYDEVSIDYRFRESGESFVRLARYLRAVLPTVWRQLNPRQIAS